MSQSRMNFFKKYSRHIKSLRLGNHVIAIILGNTDVLTRKPSFGQGPAGRVELGSVCRRSVFQKFEGYWGRLDLLCE
jgi:hypothetical protein